MSTDVRGVNDFFRREYPKLQFEEVAGSSNNLEQFSKRSKVWIAILTFGLVVMLYDPFILSRWAWFCLWLAMIMIWALVYASICFQRCDNCRRPLWEYVATEDGIQVKYYFTVCLHCGCGMRRSTNSKDQPATFRV